MKTFCPICNKAQTATIIDEFTFECHCCNNTSKALTPIIVFEEWKKRSTAASAILEHILNWWDAEEYIRENFKI